jgi:hypothetical protein
MPEIASGASTVHLAELEEIVSGPVVRVSLGTGESLWGRVLEVSEVLLRVDSGNGIRVIDPKLVTGVDAELA